MKITQEELNEIVRLHGLWLEGSSKGKQADLRGADLTNANLRYANLRYANLTGVDLRHANLFGAELRWADLTGADLTGADLRCADLTNTNLRGADLTEQKTTTQQTDPEVLEETEEPTAQGDEPTTVKTKQQLFINKEDGGHYLVYTDNQWVRLERWGDCWSNDYGVMLSFNLETGNVDTSLTDYELILLSSFIHKYVGDNWFSTYERFSSTED